MSDIRLKHGVVSLLKHLAQSSVHSPENIAALGHAGVVKCLANSHIWDESVDPMVEVVQVGAIGVVKHLCIGSGRLLIFFFVRFSPDISSAVENTFVLVIPSTAGEEPGLNQILSLGLRSDSVRVKSEGTRVLVNVIKALCAGESPTPATAGVNNGQAIPQERQRIRAEAMHAVLKPHCAEALARLIGRSGKYPILINEGTVAFSLLSMQRQGG
jgi:hypothetical protein